jgi:predicted RNA binding protein YcfA (HicA-like mRNA interferase family)
MKLPAVKSRQLIKVLEKRGCIFKRQTGSHRIFYCKDLQKIIPVSIHPKDLKKSLLRSIIKELDLSIKEFIKLLKK